MREEPGGASDPAEAVDPRGGVPVEASATEPDETLSGLEVFASLQRHLAATSFNSLAATQRAIKQSAALQDFAATQVAITESFARSIDFASLTAPLKSLGADAERFGAVARQLSDSVSKAINLPALRDAVAASSALIDFSASGHALAGLTRQREVFRQLAESITLRLPKIDFTRWIDEGDRWIPANLQSLDDLEPVAAVALDEGLPLSWVPRAEIVSCLVEAGGPEARLCILAERQDDVLEDCETVLSSSLHEWAVECRGAVQALRLGLYGPAQSHASNIIDSIVLALLGGRSHAVERAQDDLADQPLRLVAENLTLRPLFRALTPWWPNSGSPPPPQFARHPTSHAVGHSGIFDPQYALIAVMLATSLTAQYEPD